MRFAIGPVLVWVCSTAFATEPIQRTLTFEDRVKAQTAIERVYYAHQIGASKPFSDAVPKAVIEAKVRRYLDQTAALASYWKTSITDESLQRELERMARGTRMPERLQELYAALGNDPFLVKECLARPTLVERLTHNFYASDSTLHLKQERQADSIRAGLVSGAISPLANVAHRSVVEYIVDGKAFALAAHDRPSGRRVSAEEFRSLRAGYPAHVGQVSLVQESRDGFAVSVVLSETASDFRAAIYSVPKTPWDSWWTIARVNVHGSSVTAVASGNGELPRPQIGQPMAPASGCAYDQWDNGSLNQLPGGREGHTVVWTGSLMIVWGGDLADTSRQQFFVDTGGRYDPATDTWTLTSMTGAPSRRFGHTAVWTGTAMLVWGGHTYLYGNQYQSTDTGALYDPLTDSWSATSTVGAPIPRESHTALWTGSRMLIWGGAQVDSYTTTYLNSGATYDPGTGTWTATATSGAPSARASHTAVWTGTKMVIWGGADQTSLLSTGAVYDPTAMTWNPTSVALAPSGRRGHTAVWTGSAMIVWGGSDIGRTNSGGRYDPASDTWIPTSIDNAPAARDGHTAVWTGTRMVVWGGDDDSTPLDSGGRYDPANDTWTATSAVNAPSARSGHTMVWTGSLVVVWGGFDHVNFDFKVTGGRYDPATDSWTATSMMGGPSPRFGHTAIWTGNVMVIWGGWGRSDGSQSTGGKYDPLLDVWTETSTVAAPVPRAGHSAVWTGMRMLVWGGFGDVAFLNSGARYEPISDTWEPMSESGAPAIRANHAAVWTGRQMIVWGGYYTVDDFPYELNTGGRYDADTDTWSTMSVPGALQGRVSPTANWTGNVVIIWGGSDTLERGWFLDGGLYDPVADAWSSMTPAPLGAPWMTPTAVWTGREIITWGGSGYSGRSAGRFDPATNTWRLATTVGAPWESADHSAVWTGREMVVWGGTPVGNGGGRYNPTTDSWCPTTTDGAPPPRLGHTAVWTGNIMVVWGGQWYGPNVSSGGRYNPACADQDGDGFSVCQGDCDDTNANIHPGATEICNGLDDDCDGIVDNGAACDDGNPCTDDTCTAGHCAYAVNENACDDGNVCTTGDTCANGACVGVPAEGTACNDGNACTVGDTCHGAYCMPGAGTLACDDGNPCTSDSCNPTVGCVHANNTAPCDDGSLCTFADTCGGGSCHGTAIICNDHNACTDDSCDPATGTCSFVNDDTNSCSDGNPCSQTDTCHAGTCVGSNPVQCSGSCPPGFMQVGSLCQTTYDIGVYLLDNLETFCDGTGTNRYNNCSYRNYGFHWTDVGGSLAAVTHVDVQLESGITCSGTTSLVTLNGQLAGSFSPAGICLCTSNHATVSMPDVAAGAYSIGGVNFISITPSGNCEGLSKSSTLGNNFARVTVTYAPHDNSCQVGTCDPATGACGFSNLPDGTLCSDGNACTTGDTCQAGACIPGSATACVGSDSCHTCDPATGTCSVPVVCTALDQCHDAGSCDPSAGVCSNPPKADGASCSDGNPCTTGDACSGGGCQPGTGTLNCSDNNPCTDDGCSPATGCVHVANTAHCEDGNACTVGDVCSGGACRAGTAVVCNDNNVCTTDSCSPTTGCVFLNNTSACDDGNPCTVGDSCSGGSCHGGVANSCDDHNACTIDSCNPAVGCVHTDSTGLCDDGNPCTIDGCDPAIGCFHADNTALCDDSDPCTDDACDPVSGCSHIPTDGNVCNDGNACTAPDFCVHGTCIGTPFVCNDGNVCTDDSCDPVKGCVFANNSRVCDDGNMCTIDDMCSYGLCRGGAALNCDDGNPCTSDVCNPSSGCAHANNAVACDDHDACTSGDLCGGGFCHGVPVTCDDANPCTTDSCDHVSGCAFTNNTAVCDDHNACTSGDVCGEGSCHGRPVNCDDGNPCTTDSCDPTSGCFFTNNTNACDDGNACTTNDRCRPVIGAPFLSESFDGVTAPALPAGWSSSVVGPGAPWVTRGASSESVPNSAFALDNDQTADAVLESPAIAITSAAADLTFRNRWSLDHDDECFDAGALEIQIGGGTFVDILAAGGSFVRGGYTGTVSPYYANPLAGRPAWCYDSIGYPAYATTTVRLPAAVAGQTIHLRWRLGSDSSVASVGQDIDSVLVADSAPNTCHGDQAPNCDDNNPCTDDSCDPAIGCVHTNNTSPCTDGNACTAADVCAGGTCHGGAALSCNDNNPCTDDSCNPASGCVHTTNTITCDDGNACTTGDVCGDGSCHAGAPVVCNDGNPCTTDTCNPATGCVYLNNTAACDDANACTTNDRCSGGVCKPGAAANCDDGNCCTIDSCDPVMGCLHTANTTAPVFTHQPSLGACPVLWPPTHGYSDFTVSETGVTAASDCGIAAIRFESCVSSEPENGTGTGDGNSTRDCVYEAGALHLRAERDGSCSPTGRIYETTLVAIDVCGNSAISNPLDIAVWHDRAHAPVGGTVYSSSGGTTDSRNGTNGTYGSGCGAGSACANGTSQDHSDADPEMEISQLAALSVDDLRLAKQGGSVSLTWVGPVQQSQVTRFHIWRLDPVTLFWTQIAEVTNQTTSFQDPFVNDGRNWQYKVTAVIK